MPKYEVSLQVDSSPADAIFDFPQVGLAFANGTSTVVECSKEDADFLKEANGVTVKAATAQKGGDTK